MRHCITNCACKPHNIAFTRDALKHHHNSQTTNSALDTLKSTQTPWKASGRSRAYSHINCRTSTALSIHKATKKPIYSNSLPHLLKLFASRAPSIPHSFSAAELLLLACVSMNT
jgi:hypothetical protein